MKNLWFRIFVFILMLLPAVSVKAQDKISVGGFGTNISEAELAERGVPVKRLPEAFRHRVAKNPLSSSGRHSSPSFSLMTSRHQATLPQMVAGDGTTLYGNLVYSSTWTEDNAPIGIYSFKSAEGSSIEPVVVNDMILATGGGTWGEGKYHFVSYINLMGYIIANYEIYDATTWESEKSVAVGAGSVSLDMTYDATTGNIYGCFLNDAGDGFVFGRMDPVTGIRTELAQLSRAFYMVAANSKGEIYGVNEEGDLCLFEKESGKYTVIGATGISGTIYLCSGTFDLKTDKLYWALSSENSSGLYELDVKTGKATLVNAFANQEEFQGVYIPKPLAEDGAPAVVTNLALDFLNDSKSGKITFTMPSSTYAGDPLDGSLKYIVYVNEKEVKTGNANAGSEVNMDLTVNADGEYRISVRAENSIGLSPQVKVTKWIGNDYPAEPVDVLLEEGAETGMLSLTWKAPVATLHGGYLNKNMLTYNVVRHPDEVNVATNIKETKFDDLIKNTSYQGYSYSVTAVCGSMTGGTATSNIVTSGQALDLPFIEQFNSKDNFNRFSIFDANSDNKTWGYDPVWNAARCDYNISIGKDDWFITPPFKMDAKHVVLLDFRTWCKSSDNPERLSVYMGTGKKPEVMTKVVMPTAVIKNDVAETKEFIITLDNDGDYYIGFHAQSTKDKWWLYVDSISVKQGPLLGTPARVENLTITPGELGNLSATISCTAPSISVDGMALNGISRIDFYRNGSLIGSVNKPEMGSAVSFEDKNAVQGVNEYSVVAINDTGEGLAAVMSTYIGLDVPCAPRNVFVKDVDGKAVITWDAPEAVGANGAYVDVDNLVYQVVCVSDGAHVGHDVKGTTFTDSPKMGSGQGFMAYCVFAQSSIGIGEGAYSNQIVMGTPFELPFRESFANKTIATDPWGFNEITVGSTWSVKDVGTTPDATPQDNDGGLVTYIPADNGGKSELYSGKINLGKAKNPVLEFYYYSNTNSYDHISVQISVDNGTPTEEKYITFGSSAPMGWTKASVSLEKYIGKQIQIHFVADSRNGEYNIHFDNIVVKDLYQHNLVLSGISAPSKMYNGEVATVKVDVINDGAKEAAEYDVNLYRNGKNVATKHGTSLASDGKASFDFEETPTIDFGDNAVYYAEVVMENDENTLDNRSSEVTVAVTQPRFPTVSDLAGEYTADGKVVLTWSEPASSQMGSGEPIVDDMENYASFAITNIGDWKLVDLDGSKTYGIAIGQNQVLEYPNVGEAMAYQVFVPSEAGIDITAPDWAPWAPHSGNKMLACFSATEKKNDDWLISPELTGDEQEISFYGKTVIATYGLETIEIYYSKTGNNVGDFVKISDFSVPDKWTELKATLPIGARYFAIRCTSQDRFAFLLDDIKYMPATEAQMELSLVGFNVYCDSEKLTAEPLMDFTYIDEKPSASATTYRVTTVYDKGESVYSNAVVLSPTGIDGVSTSSVGIYGMDGFVRICNAEGLPVAVISVDGSVCYSSLSATSSLDVPVAKGVYIVKVGDATAKIVVR